MMLWLQHIVIVLFYCNYILADAPSVIIIGAGSAGIAAASKLLENSITNITILEAENRIGGRIHTVSFCGEIVDLGAEYCYGEQGNIVYDLAKNYNILKTDSVLTLEDNIYYSDGSKMDVELSRDFDELIEDYYGTDDGDDYDSDETTGMSVGEAMIHRYKLMLLEKYQNDSNKLEIVKEGLRYIEGNILLVDGSYSWFDVAAESDFKDLDGAWDLTLPDVGFKTILDILMKSYPNSSEKLPFDDKIFLNSEVTEIKWANDQRVTVYTSQNHSCTADYVIFTPSVGVLKHQKDKLFNPNLPSWKNEAIEALTISSIAKIIVHFPEQWWNDDDHFFSFFWREADLQSIDFPEGPTLDGLSWVTHIMDFGKLNGNIWSAWISGDLVPEIEKQSEHVLKAGLEYVLNKFLGKSYSITEADKVLKTSWTSNHNFRGGFVNVRRGYYRKDYSYQEKLGEPLQGKIGKPVLLFAGDATHQFYYSTVHGVIETGYREAQRIIDTHNEAK